MRHLRFILFALVFFISCNQQGKKNADNKKPFTNITACVFSQIAYCPDPQQQLDKHLPEWKVIWNATALNGNHAFIATDNEKYVIAIRGSLIEFSWDAFENWIYQDLNIGSQEKWEYSNTSGAKISTGSYRGFQNLIKLKDKTSEKNILGFLQENIKDKNSIIITGHSLGGNLATVLASYLSFKLKETNHTNEITVITFAAPAAGNTTFAKDFNAKFPQSVRIENEGDIVPKFPCASAVASLGKLYSTSTSTSTLTLTSSSAPPSASEITVGYKNVNTSLSNVFKGVSTIIAGLQLANGFSNFTQTNEGGTIIKVKLSGKNNSNDVASWFAEAGYQHGIAQYAAALKAPVVDCNAP